MQDTVKLKKALFGFSKTSVLEYITEISKNIDNKLFLKDNEIVKYKKNIEDLEKTIEELKKTISDFDEEKSKISQMYINAEERAEAIIKEADEKSELMLSEARKTIEKEKAAYIVEKAKIKEEAQKEIDATKAVHDELKSEISALQSRIKMTLNKFDSLLSDSIK